MQNLIKTINSKKIKSATIDIVRNVYFNIKQDKIKSNDLSLNKSYNFFGISQPNFKKNSFIVEKVKFCRHKFITTLNYTCSLSLQASTLFK